MEEEIQNNSITMETNDVNIQISNNEKENDNLINDMHRYKPINCCERHCCGGLQGMACGWPKSTVRAIVTIIMLISVLGVELFLVVWLATKANDITSAIAVGGAMMAELGGIIGFYFGSRSSKNTNPIST